MYDDYEIVINKDINICFLSGTVSSKPDFNFFYNSKKLISRTEFLLETEMGFNGSKIEQSMKIKMFAYNERADFIYKELDIGDKIMVKGFLEKDRIIVEDIFFKEWLVFVLGPFPFAKRNGPNIKKKNDFIAKRKECKNGIIIRRKKSSRKY